MDLISALLGTTVGTECLAGLLALSACVEYMYSTASRASHPDRVLVLRDFHKVVK
jgi:hypothetical protein